MKQDPEAAVEMLIKVFPVVSAADSVTLLSHVGPEQAGMPFH